MRQVVYTFFGVLSALIVFSIAHYKVRRALDDKAQFDAVSAKTDAYLKRLEATKQSLKTPDAELSPFDEYQITLWPSALSNHYIWDWTSVRKACGKPIRGSEVVGDLYYSDANHNQLKFLFGPSGVTISYAEPAHVVRPDLIASLSSIPCLSQVH
jgi:hypothetical protein